jgi:UDP-N-acetylmuramyl pentapeptide synthase
MKHIALHDILKQIGVDAGDHPNPIIKHAVKYSKRDIEDHTLVFHMDRDTIRGKFWRENRNIVILTDAPEMCSDLGENICLIETDHLEEAYWKFVSYYRSLFDIPVIGVTGTCGKTTCKEMMKQILIEDYKVKATWKSMNSKSVNLRYLTGIDEETEVAVFEMPVCYPGYLQTACTYFQPQIRILLNIGVHHLADCETPEEYMKAKTEIVHGLDPEKGILILNADDENIRKLLDVTPFQNVVYFGKSAHSHFRPVNIHYADGGMKFTLAYEGKTYDAFVPGYGEHNVYNALAAIAAVSYIGVDIETAIKRLASFEQVKEHLEVKQGEGGCMVMDDTWNSAPLSMASGLQVLKDLANDKTSIALLGYMPQLGEGRYAREQYEEMGKKAYEASPSLLVIVGEEAKPIGRKAIQLGMDPSNVHFCLTGDEVYEVLRPHLHEETVILLKITHRVMKKPSFKELRKKLLPHDEV